MTKNLTRRHFIGTLGMGAAGAILYSSCGKSGPEVILHNANIITSNGKSPRAQAIAITNGKIIGVGDNESILRLAGSATKKIDIGGKTITPGFIDAHMHFASSGRRHLTDIDCNLDSIAKIKAAVRERASETPPGEWVFGFKYDDTKTSEGRYLNRADLD